MQGIGKSIRPRTLNGPPAGRNPVAELAPNCAQILRHGRFQP
jgi:hypothetical protein